MQRLPCTVAKHWYAKTLHTCGLGGECGDLHRVLRTPGYKAVLHQTRSALTTTSSGVHAPEYRYRYRHPESLETRRLHPPSLANRYTRCSRKESQVSGCQSIT